MNNRVYSVDELIHNMTFRRLTEGTANPNDIAYWSAWMEEGDENRKRATEAIAQIAGFEITESSEVSDLDFEKEWSHLYRSTVSKKNLNLISAFPFEGKFQWVYRMVAVLLLCGMVSLAVWLYTQNTPANTQENQTAYQDTITTLDGQQKSITFSSGEKIIVNSNTSLTYTIKKNSDHTIRVNLIKGEAFFSDNVSGAKKLNNKHAFIVKTPDGLVEDIGTEFFIKVGKRESNVILQNGQVQIKTNIGNNKAEGYEMKKGEVVTLRKAHIVKKEMVNPTLYTAWATGFLQLDHTSVKEFAKYVEKRFGVEVVITKPKLADVTMEGAVYFRSLTGLVRSVSTAARISVYQSATRDTVFIGNPNS